MDLLPDEADVLWAVARQAHFEASVRQGVRKRLVSRGLLAQAEPWPQLTELGRAALQERERLLWRAAGFGEK